MRIVLNAVVRRFAESREVLKLHPSLRDSLARTLVSSIVIFSAAAVLSFIFFPSIAFTMVVPTGSLMCIVIFGVYLGAGLLKSRDGTYLNSFGTANSITIFRIMLIPSMIVLLLNDYTTAGLILYMTGVSLDMADGAAARRLGEESMFGVVLDPLGDIATTTVVFFFLWRTGLIPTWLFALLIIRYVQFFGGLALLAAFNAIPTLRATFAGKAAAVVQGISVSLFLLDYGSPSFEVPHMLVQGEYYLLAFMFLWVIISQSAIGYRALKRISV